MKEVALVLEHRPAPSNQPRRGQEIPTTSVTSPIGFWQRFLTRVRSWFEIPFGYEDEDGFHYGHEPVAPKVFTDRASDAMFSPSSPPPTTAATRDNTHRPPVERH